MQELDLMPYISRHHETPEQRAWAIHPSSLGLCLRVAYYKFLGVEPDEPPSEEARRRYASGYMIENYAIRAYLHNGSLIAADVPVVAPRGRYVVKGRLDAIVKFNGGWALVDVKSVNKYAFQYANFPYPHNEIQVGAYAMTLNQMASMPKNALRVLLQDEEKTYVPDLIHDLRDGVYGPRQGPVLHYIAKNLSQDVVVPAAVDSQARAQMAIDRLVEALEEREVPARPWETPEEHHYACAKRVRKGYQRKDGTWSKPPLYVPTCDYFGTCWGTRPDEWSFWSEVV